MSDALRQADGFRLGTRPSDGDVDQANRLIDALSARLAALEADLAAQEAVAPVSVPEAARVLLGDDFNSPMLTALDPFNNDADVAQDVLSALRALAETENQINDQT